LGDFSECFITGTAAEVTPVSEVGDYRFTPGAISETLLKDYMQLVQPKSQAAAE
jgi:branched-chain amino acid aminotransferase